MLLDARDGGRRGFCFAIVVHLSVEILRVAAGVDERVPRLRQFRVERFPVLFFLLRVRRVVGDHDARFDEGFQGLVHFRGQALFLRKVVHRFVPPRENEGVHLLLVARLPCA